RRAGAGGRQRADQPGVHADAVEGGADAGDGEERKREGQGGSAGGLHDDEWHRDLPGGHDQPEHHGGGGGGRGAGEQRERHHHPEERQRDDRGRAGLGDDRRRRRGTRGGDRRRAGAGGGQRADQSGVHADAVEGGADAGDG